MASIQLRVLAAFTFAPAMPLAIPDRVSPCSTVCEPPAAAASPLSAAGAGAAAAAWEREWRVGAGVGAGAGSGAALGASAALAVEAGAVEAGACGGLAGRAMAPSRAPVPVLGVLTGAA